MPYKSKGLGERHQKILDFISAYQKQYRRPPSVREIGENVGVTSTSVVNYYLDQLERLGYIERERKKRYEVKATGLVPPKSRMLRVFLCHSSGDKAIVYDLYKQLINDKFDAWLDKEKILPGPSWELEIKNALFDADVIIVCLSAMSISKEGFIQKEIKYALDKAEEKPEETIYIIPARLEACDIPTQLRKWQWVDLFDGNGCGKLISSLKKRSEELV